MKWVNGDWLGDLSETSALDLRYHGGSESKRTCFPAAGGLDFTVEPRQTKLTEMGPYSPLEHGEFKISVLVPKHTACSFYSYGSHDFQTVPQGQMAYSEGEKESGVPF